MQLPREILIRILSGLHTVAQRELRQLAPFLVLLMVYGYSYPKVCSRSMTSGNTMLRILYANLTAMIEVEEVEAIFRTDPHYHRITGFNVARTAYISA